MSYTQLIFQIRKIINWNQQNRIFKIQIYWILDHKLLMQKLIQGQITNNTLAINLSVKIQSSHQNEHIVIYFLTVNQVKFGEVSLNLQQICKNSATAQYYDISGTNNKILEIIRIEPEQNTRYRKLLKQQYNRIVKHSRQRKKLKSQELKKNDLFIRNRQIYIEHYKTSLSKQKKSTQQIIKAFIDQVRGIKQKITITRNYTNKKVFDTAEKSYGIDDIKQLTTNQKIQLNKKQKRSILKLNEGSEQYGFQINEFKQKHYVKEKKTCDSIFKTLENLSQKQIKTGYTK